MPTLGEFIRNSSRYGFTLRRVGIDIRGPRGVTRIDYLWRNQPQAFAPLPDYPHDQRLTENHVRSFCSQLGSTFEGIERPGSADLPIRGSRLQCLGRSCTLANVWFGRRFR